MRKYFHPQDDARVKALVGAGKTDAEIQAAFRGEVIPQVIQQVIDVHRENEGVPVSKVAAPPAPMSTPAEPVELKPVKPSRKPKKP